MTVSENKSDHTLPFPLRESSPYQGPLGLGGGPTLHSDLTWDPSSDSWPSQLLCVPCPLWPQHSLHVCLSLLGTPSSILETTSPLYSIYLAPATSELCSDVMSLARSSLSFPQCTTVYNAHLFEVIWYAMSPIALHTHMDTEHTYPQAPLNHLARAYHM